MQHMIGKLLFMLMTDELQRNRRTFVRFQQQALGKLQVSY